MFSSADIYSMDVEHGAGIRLFRIILIQLLHALCYLIVRNLNKENNLILTTYFNKTMICVLLLHPLKYKTV